MKCQLPRKRKKRFIKNFGISEYLSNVIISEILSEDPNTDKRRYKQIRSFDKEKHYEKANRDQTGGY